MTLRGRPATTRDMDRGKLPEARTKPIATPELTGKRPRKHDNGATEGQPNGLVVRHSVSCGAVL